MSKLSTRLIIALLTFLLGVVTTFWYLSTAQKPHLVILNAQLDSYFFKAIESRTKKVGLSKLRTVALPYSDIEVRLWSETLHNVDCLILRRSAGKWSASYLHDVRTRLTSYLKVETLKPPRSGWEAVWVSLVSEKILTLPDQSSNEDCRNGVIDGIAYVVESNVNWEYRTFGYGNPQYAKCDEAKRILSIVGTCWDEFGLDRFRIQEEEEWTYWRILDKARLNDLEAYLAKYPNGVHTHLAKANIKNIEAAKLVEIVSNKSGTSLESGITGVTKPDPAVDRRITGEFVFIPAGKFTMGSNDHYSEKPAHEVIVSKSFEMGKYEVTQEQWELVMGSNPSYFKGDKRLPVENVSWEDIQKFISLLNSKSTKYIYRLPTEAEWEYAAKAGSMGDYAGNLDAMAWYVNNSGDEQLNLIEGNFDSDKVERSICRTHPVGQKLPNAWGLYDMPGNVKEWCSDWYDNYSDGTKVDPSGDSSGINRVCRGGSWDSLNSSHWPIARESYIPDYHYNGVIGFRLARTPK